MNGWKQESNSIYKLPSLMITVLRWAGSWGLLRLVARKIISLVAMPCQTYSGSSSSKGTTSYSRRRRLQESLKGGWRKSMSFTNCMKSASNRWSGQSWSSSKSLKWSSKLNKHLDTMKFTTKISPTKYIISTKSSLTCRRRTFRSSSRLNPWNRTFSTQKKSPVNLILGYCSWIKPR